MEDEVVKGLSSSSSGTRKICILISVAEQLMEGETMGGDSSFGLGYSADLRILPINQIQTLSSKSKQDLIPTT